MASYAVPMRAMVAHGEHETMKFETLRAAQREARSRLIPHRAVKTRFWSVDREAWVVCYTVVLDQRRGIR